MSEETKIQWASSTWNPWMGCDKVSCGCKFCYIVNTPAFVFRGLKHGDPRVRTSEAYWRKPYTWNKAAGDRLKAGHPTERPRVFPSLCDWLDDQVPIEWLADFLKVIHDTPHLDWLLLTKRPENFRARISDALIVANGGNPKDADWFAKHGDQFPANDFADWLNEWTGGNAPANVWFGVSAESQEWLDKRWPIAREIAAQVHFVSAEPLLGPLDFTSVGPNSRSASERRGGGCTGEFVCNALTGEAPYYRESDGEPCTAYGTAIDWVIVGGESGNGARACSVEWIWDIQMQCKAAGVACFTKQLGAVPITENANIFDWPAHVQFYETEAAGPVARQDGLVARSTQTNYSQLVAAARVGLKHPKGGDPAEWPEELKVRKFPAVGK